MRVSLISVVVLAIAAAPILADDADEGNERVTLCSSRAMQFLSNPKCKSTECDHDGKAQPPKMGEYLCSGLVVYRDLKELCCMNSIAEVKQLVREVLGSSRKRRADRHIKKEHHHHHHEKRGANETSRGFTLSDLFSVLF